MSSLICFIAAIPTIVTVAVAGLALLMQYLWLVGEHIPRKPTNE